MRKTTSLLLLTKKKPTTKPLRIGFEVIFLFSCFLFLSLLFVQKQYFVGAAFPNQQDQQHDGGPSFIPPNESPNASKTIIVKNTNHDDEGNNNNPRQQEQYLAVESNSVIASDIQSIWHDPSQQQICIQLEPNARCPHAEFIGRLSGPSLIMLEWEIQKEYHDNHHDHDQNATNTTNDTDRGGYYQHCGSYSNDNHAVAFLEHDTEYFVEILILYCQNFGVGSILHQQEQQESMEEWLNVNFQQTCIENPQANRVTKLGASIRIRGLASSSFSLKEHSLQKGLNFQKNNGNEFSNLGRWVHFPSTEASKNTRPLTTRYQPQGCRWSNDNSNNNNNKTTPYCQQATDTRRFADYKFEWNNNDQEKEMKRHIEKLQWDISSIRRQVCGNDLSISDQKKNCVLQLGEMLQNHTLVPPPPPHQQHQQQQQHRPAQTSPMNIFQMPPPLLQQQQKVCVVGYSHSYHILHAMHQLHLGHLFVWAQARYPMEIDFHFVKTHIHKYHCDTFLIGVGQWPASPWGIQPQRRPRDVWPDGKPVPFGVYRHEIFRLVDMFHNLFPKVRVYMRSIHYNPIMEESGKCRPSVVGDWRTPTVLTAYSEIIREQVHNLNDKTRSQQEADKEKDNQQKEDPPRRMIQFLDTRFITYPMWDSSYDWYHLADQVAQVEALYFASTILSSRSLHEFVAASSEE